MTGHRRERGHRLDRPRIRAHAVASRGRLLQPIRYYELRGGELVPVDAPTDASLSVHREWLLIRLRTDWYTGRRRCIRPDRCWPPTTSDSSRRDSGISPSSSSPTRTPACESYAWTRDKLLILVTLVDVASRLEIATPEHGSANRCRYSAEHPHRHRRGRRHGDEIFVDSSGFTARRACCGVAGGTLTEIKRAPSFSTPRTSRCPTLRGL